MGEIRKMLALDCGNSSYRLVLGTYQDERFDMEVIAQEKNAMIKVKDYYYWDLLKMYQFLIDHVKALVRKGVQPDTIGICTWGVDFALFDQQGFQLGNALSYRNTMGEKELAKVPEKDRATLFKQTGILSDRINSVYLLQAMKEVMPARIRACSKLLMVPDIFNYMLTGVMMNEPSEISTTQLFNSQTKAIDDEACDYFNIPKDWFSKIGQHGQVIGDLLPSVKEDMGIEGKLPVICVPSHDTAAAVMAIPAEEDEFLFISSGTWALIGAELDEPIMNEAVLSKGLTNEVGAYNKITLLKNSTGMFILEKMKKEYEEENDGKISWDVFLSLTAKSNTAKSNTDTWIDVNDPGLFNPTHMGRAVEGLIEVKIEAKIEAKITEKAQTENSSIDWGKLLGVVQRSMAKNFADTTSDLEAVIGKNFDTIYIVGGGSRNQYINQLTATYSRKTVVTCGEESTCLGNLGAQLNHFKPELTLKDIRQIIKNSIEIKSYQAE